MEKKITIEIGPNLLEAIRRVINSVDRSNDGAATIYVHVGSELKAAFGIDIKKITKLEDLEEMST